MRHVFSTDIPSSLGRVTNAPSTFLGNRMEIRVIRGGAIDEALLNDWRRLQGSNPELVSPYFCPEFTACVARARPDVEIAVVSKRGETVCLFPFQRVGVGLGEPVGFPLSDYHGLICEPDFRIDPRVILKACSLKSWGYNHLPAAQTVFQAYHVRAAASPVMDLSSGFERYLEEAKDRAGEVAGAFRKLRNLERDHGEVSFTYHVSDDGMLARLIEWKSDQYRRTRVQDRFAMPWFRKTVEHVFHCQSPGFAGVLSALRVGAEPVALHFGMRAGAVWHYWFPAYDPGYSKYSPGILLLLKMAEIAPDMGVRRIDLGKGDRVRYKDALKSYDVQLAMGRVELPSLGYYGRMLRTCVRDVRNRCSRARDRGDGS